jgi:hypothetical protein
VSDLTCPACTAPGLMQNPSGGLTCEYCGSTFKGIPLVCPSCGWINTTNADECPKCGEPMNVIAQVFSRQGPRRTPLWLHRAQSQAGELKEEGEQTSSLRLQRFQEIDRVREESIREEDERQTRRNQQVFTAALIFTLIIILIILIVLLFR